MITEREPLPPVPPPYEREPLPPVPPPSALPPLLYTAEDHAFVVCAYMESPYLAECISSLLAQTQKSSIVISTSTPNDHIKQIAEAYGIPVRVNSEPPSISGDWNFAYKQADKRLITLAHQDDIYLPEYLSTALEMLNSSKDPIIFFSHYAILADGEVIHKNRRLKVRKSLLKPMKKCQRSTFIRRRLLSLGNIICCPSVMFADLESLEFSGELKCNLDWQKWEELSKKQGSFVYCEKPLLYHRLHGDAESARALQEGVRSCEDNIMFRKFWPAPIARILTKLYTKSE